MSLPGDDTHSESALIVRNHCWVHRYRASDLLAANQGMEEEPGKKLYAETLGEAMSRFADGWEEGVSVSRRSSRPVDPERSDGALAGVDETKRRVWADRFEPLDW